MSPNREGLTAMEYAQSYGYDGCVKILKKLLATVTCFIQISHMYRIYQEKYNNHVPQNTKCIKNKTCKV